MSDKYDEGRRRLLKGIVAIGLGTGCVFGPKNALADGDVPNSAGREAPVLKPPPLACDSHIHILSDKFPILDEKASLPLHATVKDYRKLQRRLRTTRTVVVQPANYRTDNRVTLDAVAQLGAANARGIAVIGPDITDRDLQRLHDGGIRGIRFSLFSPDNAVTRVEQIEPLARRVQAQGWHIQLQMRADLIVENAAMLQRLPCPVVFDHMGRLPQPVFESDAYRAMRKMLDGGKTWIKVSGAYLNTKLGPPGYDDATTVAQAFIKAAPERMVWGSDWPHPTEQHQKPDDAVLLDLLLKWAPNEQTRHRILVENPALLYGFTTT
jgi:predicted TIM-barrel fold metal-dependent hydrolase